MDNNAEQSVFYFHAFLHQHITLNDVCKKRGSLTGMPPPSGLFFLNSLLSESPFWNSNRNYIEDWIRKKTKSREREIDTNYPLLVWNKYNKTVYFFRQLTQTGLRPRKCIYYPFLFTFFFPACPLNIQQCIFFNYQYLTKFSIYTYTHFCQ